MKKKVRNIFLLVLILTAIDQVTKIIAYSYLKAPVKVIGDIFQLQLSYNDGIAFSISVPYSLLIITNIFLLFIIIFFGFRELDLQKKVSRISLALVASGGIGNLIDRFAYGFVIDFISIWKWPIFNIADVYITVGILLILVFYVKISRKTETKTNGKRRTKRSSN